MPYIMEFEVDGGCRNNGHQGAFGAAACIFRKPWTSNYTYRTRQLPPADFGWEDEPTNQRAELTAVILALGWAVEQIRNLNNSPRVNVSVQSDSKYAVNTMNDWIYKWANNGWLNARGVTVANVDLMHELWDLHDQVTDHGEVDYDWVPRSQNAEADERCTEVLDEMEDDM